MEAFRGAGFFSLLVPRSLGGGETPVAEALAVFEALAASDGAAAWCVMIGATTGFTSAYFDQSMAAEIFAPGSIAGGVFAPLGRAEPVEGNWKLTGRWSFASGCHHCDWLSGGALDGSGAARQMFFPASSATIIDTWDVSGLVGTGSHDIQVSDLPVPELRSISLTTDRPRHEGHLYAFPVFGLLALGIAAVALGIARGAIDDILELAGAKIPTGSRRRLAERPLVQAQIAEAEAILGAAGAFLKAEVDAAWRAAADGSLDLRTRARLRLAATHATMSSAKVVDMMYGAGGGSSIYRISPLQRRFRDVHAATQHVMVAPPTLELAGRVLLGLEAETATL